MSNIKHKTTLLLLFSMLTFSILLVLGFGVYSHKNQNRIINQNKQYLFDNSKQLANTISDEFQSGYLNINNLASLLSHTINSPEIEISYLQELLSNSIFDFIEFADTEGNDHNITGGISDARDREYYIEGMKGNSGMELINKSRATQETLFMFYSPVYFENEIVGVLIGVYQAKNRLKNKLSSYFHGVEAFSYLCTKDGRIVGTNDDIDTTEEIYIQNYLESNAKLDKVLDYALANEIDINFTQSKYSVGGYIQKLQGTQFFLVHVFPEDVNTLISKNAQIQVIGFILYDLLLSLILFIVVILFFIKQQHLVQSANEAKSTFLLNMSHDIRTPMNAILGFTELASKNINDKEIVLDYHKKIHTSGENLLALINAVLDMSRIETGRIIIEPVACSMNALIDDLITIVQPQFINKKLHFCVSKENIQTSYVKCDKTHLNQILLNILGNALKFTPEDGAVTFTVKQISQSRDHSGFSFTIKDTGIGMSKTFIDKLYEPFEREQNSAINKIQGTGLGLSITKHLVELMGGKIYVTSEQGKGTEFTVEFEFENADPFFIQTDVTTTMPSDILKGKKILIVEDNPFNMEITSEILQDEGAIISKVENGLEAVETITAAQKGDFDIVLMDIQMPLMNGFDATKKIRESHCELSNIPIIAVTANVFEEDIKKSREAGIDSFIAKPIQIQNLLKAVYNITEGKGVFE